MRALTQEETESIYGGQDTVISSVFVTGERLPPLPMTLAPAPLPNPPMPVLSPPTSTPNAPNPPCAHPANAVNSNSIYSNEKGPGGVLATKGYVPSTGSSGTSNNPSSTSASGTVRRNNSGMTIGYGVDLGQMNMTQLVNYLTGYGTIAYPKGGLVSPVDALSPYLGVRGPAAVAAVSRCSWRNAPNRVRHGGI